MQKEEINTILFSRHSSVKCSKGNNISVWENIPTLQKYFLALLKSKLRPVLVYFMKKNIYICKRSEIPPVEGNTDDKRPGPSCLRKG